MNEEDHLEMYMTPSEIEASAVRQGPRRLNGGETPTASSSASREQLSNASEWTSRLGDGGHEERHGRRFSDGESRSSDMDFWHATTLDYDALRRLAQKYLACERKDHTLDATAVVHEAFLRVARRRRGQWKDRSHFFSTAAREMRRVLIDHARRTQAVRRGGDQQREQLRSEMPSVNKLGVELLELDELLRSLAAIDLRKARVVELRYFTGLTIEETASVLALSRATVIREWRMARAWLRHAMRGSRPR